LTAVFTPGHPASGLITCNCSACLAVSLSPETYIWLDEFVILTAGSANAA